MKIQDIFQLLQNRLHNFKLSRDYALMNGDLEKVNSVETEISTTQDTLYQLNLLLSASQTASNINKSVTDVVSSSAAISQNVTDVINTKNNGIINGYNITSYATDPLHEVKIAKILSGMPKLNNSHDIDKYIEDKAKNSPVTGEMILYAANKYAVDFRLMMAIMEQDSHFGTQGLAVQTTNPGNVGNDDAGNIRSYSSWQEGVNAVADWLTRRRVNNTRNNYQEVVSNKLYFVDKGHTNNGKKIVIPENQSVVVPRIVNQAMPDSEESEKDVNPEPTPEEQPEESEKDVNPEPTPEEQPEESEKDDNPEPTPEEQPEESEKDVNPEPTPEEQPEESEKDVNPEPTPEENLTK
jgi:hypothetical protein